MRTLPLLLLTACSAFASGRTLEQDDATLRAMGPEGLQVLLEQAHWDDPEWHDRVDTVAAQKDAAYAGLYWYTDREEALAAAAREDKLVLSLRMLGELTDTWSCANSRFFRTVLYANPEVSAHLRDTYVLHWSSERPVPKITIDMGDGRTLTSTVTGNSAHYVMDPDAQVLDVLPGLYTPADFLDELASVEVLHDTLRSRPSSDRQDLVRAHHTSEQEAAVSRLRLLGDRDPKQAVFGNRFTTTLYDAERSRPLHLIPASAALPMAFGKMAVEMPITDSFLISRPPTDVLHPSDLIVTMAAPLHPVTQELIRRDQPQGADQVLRRFSNTLQRDSTWNRDVLHSRVRGLFLRNQPLDFDSLNARVYSGVFGTPREDAWLGLYDPTVYAALPGAGITE